MAESNQDFKQEKAQVQKNYLLMMLVLLNLVLMGGVAYFQWTLHQKIQEQPSVTDLIKEEMKKIQDAQDNGERAGQAIEENGILFPLDAFTANLAQGDGPRRYLRLSAVLKFSKESNEEEFKSRKPQIRDTIISLVNTKRAEDLLKVEGKNYLKEEIKASINSFLINGQVVDVYYVGFQIN